VVGSNLLPLAFLSSGDNLRPLIAMAAPEDPSEASTRLENELNLLQEMYPHHITFYSKSRDFKYTSPNSSNATLVVRLPEHYPVDEDEPQVISACDRSKNDIRDKVQRAFDFDQPSAEVLDIMVERFEEVTAETTQASRTAVLDGQYHATHHKGIDISSDSKLPFKTVIIWLHHLLATTKRKLAVNPSLNTSVLVNNQVETLDISGITKPGSPGIMIFSGRSDLVDAHVRELKDLNWQAFQIRFDSAVDGGGQGDQAAKQWEFLCCRGKIVEVETMAQIVQNIVNERNKQTFLKAVGVK
jgi:hypothetical protein